MRTMISIVTLTLALSIATPASAGYWWQKFTTSSSTSDRLDELEAEMKLRKQENLLLKAENEALKKQVGDLQDIVDGQDSYNKSVHATLHDRIESIYALLSWHTQQLTNLETWVFGLLPDVADLRQELDVLFWEVDTLEEELYATAPSLDEATLTWIEQASTFFNIFKSPGSDGWSIQVEGALLTTVDGFLAAGGDTALAVEGDVFVSGEGGEPVNFFVRGNPTFTGIGVFASQAERPTVINEWGITTRSLNATEAVTGTHILMRTEEGSKAMNLRPWLAYLVGTFEESGVDFENSPEFSSTYHLYRVVAEILGW